MERMLPEAGDAPSAISDSEQDWPESCSKTPQTAECGVCGVCSSRGQEMGRRYDVTGCEPLTVTVAGPQRGDQSDRRVRHCGQL